MFILSRFLYKSFIDIYINNYHATTVYILQNNKIYKQVLRLQAQQFVDGALNLLLTVLCGNT